MSSLFAIGTDHYAIRAHKVFNGSTFFEEFRIGDYFEIQLAASLLQNFSDPGFHPVCGTHGNSRFVHDDLVIVHVFSNLAGCCQYMRKIRAAVFLGGSANGYEKDEGLFYCFFDVCAKTDPAFCYIAFYHAFQAGFEDGDFTPIEHIDLAAVVIHAYYVVSHIGKTSAAG